jgi:3-oxoacyl-[acyl-carrier protein] reductase
MSGRDFDGFTVVVTGASTGLGRAIAVETARRGAALVVVNFARSAEEAEETVRLVASLRARRRRWSRATSRIDADCQTNRGKRRPARAGSTPCSTMPGSPSSRPTTPISTPSNAEDFLRLYAVNVVGAFQMVRAARSLLEAAPQPGAVVNTSLDRRGGRQRLVECPTPLRRAP